MDTSDKNGVSYIKYHYKLTTAIIVEKSLAAVPNDCLSGLVSLVFAVSIEPYWQYETSARATVTVYICLLYTSPSPRDATLSRMPSSA